MPRIVTILSYAGTLPFIICAVLPYAGIATIPALGTYDSIAASYAAIIASFMAGTHWGLALTHHTIVPRSVFIASTALTLLALLAWMILPATWRLLSCIAIFLGLLAVDYRLYKMQIIHRTYYKLRLHVTGFVVILLTLIAVLTWLDLP